ncbi:hypothetical protein ACHAO7_011880 [Fusarium culmorum]
MAELHLKVNEEQRVRGNVRAQDVVSLDRFNFSIVMTTKTPRSPAEESLRRLISTGYNTTNVSPQARNFCNKKKEDRSLLTGRCFCEGCSEQTLQCDKTTNTETLSIRRLGWI